jgi:hypothetical protein
MEWPPYSPDLNPIENLWSDFKTRFHKHFTNLKAHVSSAQEAKERYGELFEAGMERMQGGTCACTGGVYASKMSGCGRQQRRPYQVLDDKWIEK